jgi:N-acetylglucosaminyldiphosphoundecaprenol N-acetyl-beta-D-mannosaminyltransferase
MSANDRDVAFLLGLPFHVITMDETIEDAVAHIEQRRPGYYITANADFIAQAYNNEALKDILFHADRVVCDGMPLVWLSRYFKPDLPERVAGSDMVFRLFAEASQRGWKVYFLGSDEKTLREAQGILAKQYPGMDVVGTFSPPFGSVEAWPNKQILREVAAARPDLLLVAVGCPKQEYWIARYYKEAGIPLSIGIGASLDFITGTQTRAPLWVQKIGMEWMWRLLTNPKRLLKRYLKDFYYLIVLANRQRRLTQVRAVRPSSEPGFHEAAMPEQEVMPEKPAAPVEQTYTRDCHWICWKGEVERGTLEECAFPPSYEKPVFLDLSEVEFIDSSGIGLMAKMARQTKAAGQVFGLIHPSETVENVVKAMHLDAQFPIYHDEREALDFLDGEPNHPKTHLLNENKGRDHE